MNKNVWLLAGCLLGTFQGIYAQKDSILSRIVLIGDAGEMVNNRNPVIESVKRTIPFDKKTTIIFLGDNVYPNGMPNPYSADFSAAKAILDTEINIAKGTKATVYMIPGNHDWENNTSTGYDAILREWDYVSSSGLENVFYYPESGCPGPVEVSVGKDVVLILFDSQWWLRASEKPGIESDCEFKTKDEVLTAFADIVKKNFTKLIIFACHHPFKSNGIHGGYYGIKQHIFPFTELNKSLYIPLPVLGTIYPISRGIFGSPQDLKFPAYFNMITEVQRIIKAHPYVIFAAGHDHGLQLLKDSSFNFIVSGSGSKENRVTKSRLSKFIAQSPGFATLDILVNKTVRANFYVLDKDSAILKYSDTILNFSKLPVLAKDTATMVVSKYQDSITVPASNLYKNPTSLRTFAIGKNYRKEWSTPVRMKVFNLQKEKGGFVIESLGGGKQTKTLSLKDKNGKKWILRTIDKDPEKALPENLRTAMAKDIAQDFISASHPYGALAVPSLAHAAGIIEAKPEYFFVTDDYSLGDYRPLFANKVCMLEEKDPTYDGSDTKSSYKVINKLLEDNKRKVDQRAVLNARLLDVLIGDWDRHFDQWKWALTDSGKGKTYYPVPKDRDQAFFYSDGLLVRMASRRILPFLKGFRKDIPKINDLGFSAKDFDRMFLTHLSKSEWDYVITKFIAAETDSVFNEATRNLPPEIYALDKNKIYEKLKSRRNILKERMMVYYNFLAQTVTLLGSNKDELFKITGNAGKGVDIVVFSKKIKPDTNVLMYKRSFLPHETKEIRLFGFDGDDSFTIDSNITSTIKIFIIGGKGVDTFNVKSGVRTYLYDRLDEKSIVVKGAKTKVLFENDPFINEYDFKDYKYDIQKIPQLVAGYNADDGVLLGGGLLLRKYKFRKEPFGSEHRLSALFALGRKAYQFKYSGVFTKFFRRTDLLVHAQISNPSLSNFFGYGNTTKLVNDKKMEFYRARYNFFDAGFMFRKKYFDKLNIMAGPYLYHYWNKGSFNKNYILGKPSLVGLDSADIYTQKTYAGIKAEINVDNLNNELFPTRGVSWNTSFFALRPVTKNANPYTALRSDMVVYASLSDPARVVAVLKFGAGHIFSNKFEFYQSMSLGSDNYLRGFRKNRYSGSSVAYGALELRIKLFDSKSYLFPGPVGVIVFNETGRVGFGNEHSRLWHYAYGGGFYFIPYHLVILSGTIGFAGEETLFNFSIGTKFNLTF